MNDFSGRVFSKHEVKIEIKLADKSNFTEFSMDSFDRFQEVKNVYRIENGKLILKNNLLRKELLNIPV